MTASKNGNEEILFLLAKDYLALAFTVRFNIGMQLNLVDEADILSKNEGDIDEIIFTAMYKQDLVPQFVELLYKAE